jgi:hypothetical protein
MEKEDHNQAPGKSGKKDGEKITQKNGKQGKTPKEVVDEHIRDKNDVITEEEFKNLDLNLDSPGDVSHKPLDIPESSERPKDGSKDRGKITPWDVIE